MFDAPLTLREYVTHQKVPLADIFRAVAGFLSGRRDVVVFGAQAVNAYVGAKDERMTSDLDVISTRAAGVAEEIRAHLATKFRLAVRVRAMTKKGAGYRVYQIMKPQNRPLVDVRQEERLPDHTSKGGVRIVEPITLLAMKVKSYVERKNQIKGDTDRVDIRRLLRRFPKLRKERGEVTAKLVADGVSATVLATWFEFVRERLDPDSDEY
jgi:hypothetical protein